jgi:hypothetical protein
MTGILTLLGAAARADIGLGMRFGDVILEGVQMGRTYDLREAAHVPFGVENKGDADADIVVEFRKPTSGLAKDYEAIPDPSWMQALPAKMRIGAHSVGFFDLLLTVPVDEKYKGHHYQVMVIGRTADQGTLNVAVENRVRFSIGPGPESLQAEKKKKAMQKLDFDVTPQQLFLGGVPVGKEYHARKDAKKSIRVANYSSEDLSVVLDPQKWDPSYPVPDGYTPIPDPKWLSMAKSTLTVEGEQIGLADLIVNIPDDAQWKGKRFAAMVKTGLSTGFWLDAPVKVLIETEP